MNRLTPVVWCFSLIVAYLAGYGTGPSAVSAGQAASGATQSGAPSTAPLAGALPPGDYSKIVLAPDQGETTVVSGDDLRKAHTQLQARAKSGVPANAASLMKPMVTRTHSYILLHRAARGPNEPMTAEQHEGVTDVYLVVGGTGTVYVGGEMIDKRIARPGEYLGTVKGGKPFKVGPGSILNIPPNTVHGTVPDPGGLTYVLQKINVGVYPWSLINGTP
jgi:mannose-6-phosphate isomerase-like protein (cupin superfamily)